MRMNKGFFQQRTQGEGGMPALSLHGLAAGCGRAMRFLMIRGGMLPELKTALQKRELEKKLRANGYDRRLQKLRYPGLTPTAETLFKETP